VQGYLANKADLPSYPKYCVFGVCFPWISGCAGKRTCLPAGVWSGGRTRRSRARRVALPKVRNPAVPSAADLRQPCLWRRGCHGGLPFADKKGKILSYTGDMLAASYDPPELYGYVEMDGGGRLMCKLYRLHPPGPQGGAPVTLTFRKKYYDPQRDIHGYFWKALPQKEVGINGNRDPR